MSASLVGSEMCIRDRGHLLRRGALCEALLSSRALGSPELSGAPYRAVAVSYTHLTLPTICSV
eukprot:13225946-Alexandrium_andersonii.AAC.1